VPALTRPWRLLVVDAHPVVRDGLALLLGGVPSMHLVGAAESGGAALDRAPALAPDLVLLDVRLPDMLAPELVTALRAAVPAARAVLFTADGDHHAVRAALDAGAHGVVLKDATVADLVAALRRVLHGERVQDPRIALPLPGGGLTRREYEVLRLAAQGHTNPEIAHHTGLTRNTVKTYMQSTLQKLGARNRIEAIGKAGLADLL
jgi:two-component system nitrate/nitrite response regulator NarL